MENSLSWEKGASRRAKIDPKIRQIGPKLRLGCQKWKPRGSSLAQELLRGAQEAPRKPRMESLRRQVGPRRSPTGAKLRPRGVKMGRDGAKIVPKKG